MSAHVVEKLTREMINRNIVIQEAKVLIMGISFKENCPDIRNSKVADVAKQLEHLGCKVDIYDPLVNPEEVKKEYGFNTISELKEGAYDASIIAVGHKIFKEMGVSNIRKLEKENGFIFDLKYLFKTEEVDLSYEF